jgi:hypothetical protein
MVSVANKPIMQSFLMLNVVMMSVVAPWQDLQMSSIGGVLKETFFRDSS